MRSTAGDHSVSGGVFLDKQSGVLYSEENKERGRSMKRKWIFLCLVFVVALSAVWLFSPQPIVEDDFEIGYVRTGAELEFVTDQVDLEALKEVLRTGTRSRFPKKVSACRLTGDTVQIASAGNWHIDFSVTHCVVYDSGKRHGYAIQNGGELWADVLALMPETD